MLCCRKTKNKNTKGLIKQRFILHSHDIFNTGAWGRRMEIVISQRLRPTKLSPQWVLFFMVGDGGRYMKSYMLALKTSTSTWDVSYPLTFHWPQQATWQCLTSEWVGSEILLCGRKEENKDVCEQPWSQKSWQYPHVLHWSHLKNTSFTYKAISL